MAKSKARGHVFVERVLTLRHTRGTSKLGLRVYRPMRMKTGEYGCAYQISASRIIPGHRRVIFGVDGLQALLLALSLVDLDLDGIVRAVKRGRIDSWGRRDLQALRLNLARAPRASKRRVR